MAGAPVDTPAGIAAGSSVDIPADGALPAIVTEAEPTGSASSDRALLARERSVAAPAAPAAVPTGQGAMPSGQGAMPSGQDAMRTDHGAMRTNQGAMPSGDAAAPSGDVVALTSDGYRVKDHPSLDARRASGAGWSARWTVVRRAVARAGLFVGHAVRARPWLLTAALCGLTLGLGLTGPDTPAQEYRVWLFEHAGARLWDNQWYGGHTVLGYSVLFPPLGALFGTKLLGAMSCVASTALVARLLRGPRRRRGHHDLAVLWFAVVTVANLVVGRGAFALGMAFGALALVGVRERRSWVAWVGALGASLSSPLAGAFVLLVGAAMVGSLPWRRILPMVGAVSGLVVSLVFPEEGVQPFPALTYLCLLTLIGGGLLVVPRRERAVRRGLLLWGLAATVFFFVPSSVGGNITRPATMLAGPMAAVLLARRPRVLLVVAIPLVGWSVGPIHGALITQGDPSASPSYYSSLLAYLDRGDGLVPAGRVEIPFTKAHWEARYVAPQAEMARGWLRQLDTKDNALFYDGTLTASTYHDWLLARGVTYVALPNVPLDASGQAEAELLRSGLPYLDLAWQDANWKVWIVTDSSGLVRGPATLTELGVSSVAVDFQAPGVATVLVHFTSLWSITEGDVCVFRAAGDWTGILAESPGPVRLSARLSVDGLTKASALDCPADQRVH